MSSNEPFVERRSTDVLRAIHRALRPLIRFLLSRGITFPAFAETMKQAFVLVARDDLPLEGKRDTDSRLSILTGIHRRDIKRIREVIEAPASRPPGAAPDESRRNPTEISLSARVIALWTGLEEYRDGAGNPKPLARFARHGGEQSFEALVRQINRDIRPRALLDEWLRRGAVSVDEQDRLCLNVNAFMHTQHLEDKAHYLAMNVHDHIAVVAHNMEGAEPPLLERCVYYGRLTPESVQELEALAREEGMRALQKINARALQLKQRDEAQPNATDRMNFGVYFYRTPRKAVAENPDPPKDTET